MPVVIESIQTSELSDQEKESILAHAIDLHLVGSDDADSIGFDLVEKKSTTVQHILRVTSEGKPLGVVYLLPVPSSPDRLEMTVLVHEEYRGKHYTAPIVEKIEEFLRISTSKTFALCAAVHDHNPMRHELTQFLLRHGYSYDSVKAMFVKLLR